MSDAEDGVIEGALVPTVKWTASGSCCDEPAASIRYEDEMQPDAVTRVLVVVERADGSVREYEAREPRDFRISDPEQVSTMAFRTTGLSVGGAGGGGGIGGTSGASGSSGRGGAGGGGGGSGSGFRSLQAAVPALSLSFSAHPRYNLHIRNGRRKAGAEIQRGS